MKKANMRQRIQIRSLLYLLKKETHASSIHSEVSDYDTYWIYFTPREQNTKGEEGEINEGPHPVKMLLEPEPEIPLQARRVRNHVDKKSDPELLTPGMINGAVFEIRHFYKETETTYTSPITAALARLTGVFWLFFPLARASEGQRVP